jgi:glutamyl endopeptidase
MHALSKTAHKPISNRSQASFPLRFLSAEPNVGLGMQHPTHPDGFEAIPGYRLKVPKLAKPRHRHIAELTYGSPPMKLQVGEGAPTQTQVLDTTLYPWRANVMLKIVVPGKTDVFLGSGWFVGPCAVVTAAHAVYPREPGIYTGWASQVEVIPGLNGDSNPPPFGSFTSSLFYCPDGWQSDGDLRLDYGVVLLNQSIGSQVGTYGYATYSDDDLRSSVANLAGYPEYKPDGGAAKGTQWYDAGNVADVDESFIYYHLETQPGESGSCVFKNAGDQRYAMAIHTAGQGGVGAQTGPDRGVRIIEPVFENLQQWATMRG